MTKAKPERRPPIFPVLRRELEDLTARVEEEGGRILERWRPLLRSNGFRPAAENLAHYLALRRIDLRSLQPVLASLGLSSLGRCEPHVLPSLRALLNTVSILAGYPGLNGEKPRPEAFTWGDERLFAASAAVLGPPPPHRSVRIMATLPESAAGDAAWFRDLARRGVDIARVNCAHGDHTLWGKLIRGMRAGAKAEGRPCRIFMDLAGPKLRTGKVVYPKGEVPAAGMRLLLARSTHRINRDYPWQAGVTLPEAFTHLKAGDRVWIDDGNFGGRVERLVPEGALVVLESVPPEGGRLKPDKGINLPNTRLDIAALTGKDRDDLPFVARHADVIGCSFAQDPGDIAGLQGALAPLLDRNAPAKPLVAKIETERGVRRLPEIIVQGAGHGPFGVMIARGDLAVEIGFARMAEIQEEILWVCEAASVPVIWATQVLESLTKKGRFSRAEMTDAAMSQRAECVMLNKGGFLGEAVSVLDDILVRMQGHQRKKNPQLRSLRSW